MEDTKKAEKSEREAAWNERVKYDAQLHQEQAVLEEAEARKGEETWVRMGGILRDPKGNRDWTRTLAIREELKLRDIEAALQRRWKLYEQRWRNLLENQGPVEFRDIPWPVDCDQGSVDLKDLKINDMEEFFLGGLRVRGCETTQRDRIRACLLRWHPDKMTAILARVTEGDAKRVMEGIRLVTDCLQRLNTPPTYNNRNKK